MHFSVLCIIHDIISEIEFLLADIMWRRRVLVMVLVLEREQEGGVKGSRLISTIDQHEDHCGLMQETHWICKLQRTFQELCHSSRLLSVWLLT